MSIIAEIRSILKKLTPTDTGQSALFFKTGTGNYAEHDIFIDVPVPKLRAIAKQFDQLTLNQIKIFMRSPVNEERFLALAMLVSRYQKSDQQTKENVYQFYLDNLDYVNNWNLVDASAHLIIGAHLWDKNRESLFAFATSPNMWERRIAIVATWYFIRHNDLEYTFAIARLLLNDTHDLIHKATGWMLREAGKRDQQQLELFLDKHATNMPRTALRYAIEKFPENIRKDYLLKK